MHVIICGGRDYWLTEVDKQWLNTLRNAHGITKAYAGGAPGADTSAYAWAKEVALPFEECKADWKLHGKAAGPLRNAGMLVRLAQAEVGVEIAVIAFPGGRGTADMVRRAREAGVRIIEGEFA